MRRGDRQRSDAACRDAGSSVHGRARRASVPRNSSHAPLSLIQPLERADVDAAALGEGARSAASARPRRRRPRKWRPAALDRRSGALRRRRDTSTASRRGVAKPASSPCGMPALSRPLTMPVDQRLLEQCAAPSAAVPRCRSRAESRARRQQRSARSPIGGSAAPSCAAARVLQQREAERLAALEIRLGDRRARACARAGCSAAAR